jgi:hypothetical protein
MYIATTGTGVDKNNPILQLSCWAQAVFPQVLCHFEGSGVTVAGLKLDGAPSGAAGARAPDMASRAAAQRPRPAWPPPRLAGRVLLHDLGRIVICLAC